tara:strand:+ start:545 stop:730 length:186 start_codon:yes stop_codon:yes gene_type:complete
MPHLLNMNNIKDIIVPIRFVPMKQTKFNKNKILEGVKRNNGKIMKNLKRNIKIKLNSNIKI